MILSLINQTIQDINRCTGRIVMHRWWWSTVVEVMCYSRGVQGERRAWRRRRLGVEADWTTAGRYSRYIKHHSAKVRVTPTGLIFDMLTSAFWLFTKTVFTFAAKYNNISLSKLQTTFLLSSKRVFEIKALTAV